MAPHLLLTGATGYIGGSVLDAFVAARLAVEITATVRKPEAAEVLKHAYGSAITVAVTGHDEPAFARLVADADIVVHAGNSSADAAAAQVIADNVKAGAFVLHTSGTGSLIDNSKLDQADDVVVDDATDLARLTSWPDAQLYKDVETLVYNLHKTKDVKTLILSPPMIYGKGSGKFNVQSIQIPFMIRFAQTLKKNAVYGTGAAIWSSVHIADLADLYVLIVRTYLSAPAKLHYNEDGFYFVEAGAQDWKALTAALDAPLVKHGIISAEGTADVGTPNEKHYTDEELKSLGEGYYPVASWLFVSNSRCKATKARELGWTPKHTQVFPFLDESVKVFKELGAPR